MTKTLKQIVDETAQLEVQKGKFSGTLSVEEINSEPSFSAGIENKQFKSIKVEYNPKFEEKNPGLTEIVIRDITRHEIDHRKYAGFQGCPRNAIMHADLIIEPINQVLEKKGYGLNDVCYVANALEDTILQTDLAKRFDLDGIRIFWQDVGNSTKNRKFEDFYEAHVKLNLYLWGNKKQKREMQKYFKNKTKVKEVLLAFLKRSGIMDIRYENNKDRTKIRDYLNNESNWQEISKIYAEEFSKLMTPNYAQKLPNHSGKGTKGIEQKDCKDELESKEQKDAKGSKNNSKPKEQSQNEGNGFDHEIKTPEFMKGRVQRAYSKDESIPSWMNKTDALDMLYQSLSQKMEIKAKSYTQQTSLPVYWYGQRPFDPQKDDFKHTTFNINDKGKVELKKKTNHVDIPLDYKVTPQGFPRIKLAMLDTSESMKWPIDSNGKGKTSVIPWGDNSKYHHALLSWYGLLEYMKQNRLLSSTGIDLVNFSNKTYIAKGLTDSKRMALNPQWGGTVIDMGKIKELFDQQGMLVFTISDGDIQNWADIKNEFIKKAKMHTYFHLQIGEKNLASSDMEKAGLHVEYVKSAKDLADKVIDLTDKTYRR